MMYKCGSSQCHCRIDSHGQVSFICSNYPSVGDISYQHVASLDTYAAIELGVKLGVLTPSFLALVGLHQTLIKMGVFGNLIKNIKSINKTLK